MSYQVHGQKNVPNQQAKLTPTQARRQLRKVLQRYEPPKDCDCELVEIPCGCQKPCSCFPSFEKCEHIRKLEQEFEEEQYTIPFERLPEFLAAAYPGEYDEPPPPPKPACRVTRDGELHVFEARLGMRKPNDSPKHGLRHPEDILPTQAEILAMQATLGKRPGGELRSAKQV